MLLWNAVLYYMPGEIPLTNVEKPDRDLIKKYLSYTKDIINIVEPKKIYCLGLVHYTILKQSYGSSVGYICHPRCASNITLENEFDRIFNLEI